MVNPILSDYTKYSILTFQMSELSQFNDDGNVLTHGGLANRKARGRKPLDYQDNKGKVIRER